MTEWIIAGCVAVVLISTACMMMSGQCSRHEEQEDNKSK